MTPLSLDAWIFILLIVIGYGTLSLSRKYKLPEPIILLILGLVGQFFVKGIDLKMYFVFAAIILVFDAGAHFVPRRFKAHELLISEFVIYSIIINSLLVGFMLYFFIFNSITLTTILLSVLFGSLITACSQFEILRGFKIKRNRLYYLTELEDHLSNPIVAILAVVILGFLTQLSQTEILFNAIRNTFSLFFVDLSVGVFAGLIMLYVSIKIFKRKYISVITTIFAIFTFLIAREMDGIGLISVIILSLFFHNVNSKVHDMGEFGPFISNLVYVFVFISLGYIVKINLAVLFFSVVLLVLYLLFRFVFLHIPFRDNYGFLTLDCPKGLMVGAFTLIIYGMYEIHFTHIIFLPQLLSAVIMFFVYTIILSYLVNLIKHNITK